MADIQFNPLRFPLYVMTKPIGAACNLNCDYCYFLEKGKAHQNRMSDEMLDLFTEQYVLAQPGRMVLFNWHGGEPLLLGMDFYKKALRSQARFRHSHRLDNILQTNGTLLNDEWCRFFRENHFLLGLSLDGPQHCHDRYRKNKAGEGSFTQSMKGLELLQKHGVEFNILSVVNDYNVKFPLEVYQFFKSTGAQYIQFTPVVERVDADSGMLLSAQTVDGKLTDWSVPPLEYGQFLNRIFDEWVRKDVGETFVTNFDATLAGYVGAEPNSCVWAKTCGHAAALDTNGDLYACDHYFFPEYQRGNIRSKTITEMMLSPEQLRFGNDKKNKLPKTCLCCKYLSLCNGECPKNRFLHLPSEPNAMNYLCPGLKLFFEHTEPYMRFMANELKHERPPANIMKK
jgi:uncharacterized protein